MPRPRTGELCIDAAGKFQEAIDNYLIMKMSLLIMSLSRKCFVQSWLSALCSA